MAHFRLEPIPLLLSDGCLVNRRMGSGVDGGQLLGTESIPQMDGKQGIPWVLYSFR